MTDIEPQWGQPKTSRRQKEGPQSASQSDMLAHKQSKSAHRFTSEGEGVWLNADLRQKESTAKLDDQTPATLYYLGRVIKLDEVVEVYVDQNQSGEIKHWTVIDSRDFDVMDQIYDIELDTHEKFPYANLDFRVTVHTPNGPSAAHRSMKIYNTG